METNDILALIDLARAVIAVITFVIQLLYFILFRKGLHSHHSFRGFGGGRSHKNGFGGGTSRGGGGGRCF